MMAHRTVSRAEARWDTDADFGSPPGWVVAVWFEVGTIVYIAPAPAGNDDGPDADPAEIVADALRWAGWTLRGTPRE